MDAKSTNQTNHHAIILPLDLQGHINPCIKLSLNLALRGFTITFLNFERIHQDITKASGNNKSNDIFEAARQGSDLVDIRYRVISDGLPVDYDRNGRLMEYLEYSLHGGLHDHLEKAIKEVVLESKPKVTVLIADTFLPWATKIGKCFGLRCASFWTQPALAFNLYYHVHLLRQNRHFDCPDTRKDPIDYIPGVKSIEPKDLISYLQDKDTSTIMHKVLFKSYEDVKSVDYVLCNTIQELEQDTISALQSLIPFYPIGPLWLPESTKSVVQTSFWAESNCLEWLNDKAHGSVLYVSFGSLANLTKSDVLEVAYGLMDSQVDFIWVLRPRIVLVEEESNDILPHDFEKVVQGRGVVVPWTNQTEVLSHRAVGGFLTHCGWNSVLESIWYEVPMLCFPMFADQFCNRKLVVEDWKIGINLCNNEDWKIGVNLCNGNPMTREEIVQQVKSLMGQKSRKDLTKNISGVKHMLQKALEAGGSSEENLNQFIVQLSK